MNSLRFGLAAIGLAMLLAAALGEADAGANSGGGFYDGSNINVRACKPLVRQLFRPGIYERGTSEAVAELA